MTRFASDKTAVTVLLTALIMILAACSESAPRASASLNESGSPLEAAETSAAAQPPHRSPGTGQAGRPSRLAAQQPAAVGRAQGRRWAIVLGTFSARESGRDHAQAAHTMVREMQRITPELHGARVHTTESGSMVVFGNYSGPDDPRVEQDLERVKQLNVQGQPVFPRAFLGPLPADRSSVRTAAGRSSPHELMSVRERYPHADPLYTLQVALWTDFGSGEMSPEDIRRGAERQVRELRTRGHEAYVHHDAERQMSIVTVGLFDRTAIDPATGALSSEVMHLMRSFPAHLVNGEELREPVDPRRPGGETRVQQPTLVVVPRR